MAFFFKVEGAIKTLRWRRYRVMFCTFCMSLFSLLYMFVINAFPWLAWEEFTVTTRPIKMYVKKICEWNFDCDTHPLAWESVMWKKISLFVVIITVALVIFLHHLLDFFRLASFFTHHEMPTSTTFLLSFYIFIFSENEANSIGYWYSNHIVKLQGQLK